MTARPCSCEHVRHFPLDGPDDPFLDEPRDGHPYASVPAVLELGETIVGPVCQACADGCGVFEASASWRKLTGGAS